MDTPTKDSEAYEKKISGYFNGGIAALAVSMARDTGLLDVLYEAQSPLTVQQIADQGRMKHRYVSELLGALMAADIIEISEDSKTFHLPENRKPILKKYDVLCSFPTYVAERYNALQECFKSDGPFSLSYSQFPSVCRLISDLNSSGTETKIDTDILPAVPGIVEQLESGIDVLEVGCNTGLLILELAKRFPKSRFTGGDLVVKSLEKGKEAAKSMNLTNIKFNEINAMDLPESFAESFDWVLVEDVIHDLSQPDAALAEIYRSLRKGKHLTYIDPAAPGKGMAAHRGNTHSMFFYLASTFVCVPGGFENIDSVAPGAMWGEENVKKAIEKSGFKVVKEVKMQKDPYLVHFVCQK